MQPHRPNKWFRVVLVLCALIVPPASSAWPVSRLGMLSMKLQPASPVAMHVSLTPRQHSELARQQRVLKQQLRQIVGSALLPDNPAAAFRALAAARMMIATTMTLINRPQALLVVDRAPSVQRLWVVVATPDGSPWTVIGTVRVSTGKPGRKEHFKTPVGVFVNTPDILGYRALGTRNKYGIRGIGQKGMRVWDFGWQTTEDWRTPGAVASVRLEMHATDPTFLEERLGRPDSEACIRIPDRFNQFLDRFGLIDAQLTALAPTSRAAAALLPTDATPSPLAGDKVVVVDTSEPNATPSNPAMAEEMERHFADWLASRAPSLTTQEPATAQVGIAVTGSGTKSSSRTPDRSSRREASGGSFRAASLKSESNER
jgi:hypothetical protein